MGKFIDLTGQKFGKLTAISYDQDKKKWLCKCDCGNDKYASCGHLRSGQTKSCGCLLGKNNGNFQNIIGLKFDKLTVLKLSGNVDDHGKKLYDCECECHNHVERTHYQLVHLKNNSCLECSTKHKKQTVGVNSTSLPEYKNWSAIYDRCYNKNLLHYSNWGGRGIRMCDRWKNSFKSFYEDMGPKPGPEYSIDRIDNDGDYCPENCRWATHEQQIQNSRVAKLTELDVKEIREKYQNELKSFKNQKEFCQFYAKKYNIDSHSVWCVITNKTWKNI